MAAADLIVRGPEDKDEDKQVPSGSLSEHYVYILEKHGGKVALLQQVAGVEVSVTYSELLRQGKVLAGLLRQHGLGSGDTVMLCCGNTLEFAPIMLATLFVGAALAPVNPTFVSGDMLHMVNVIKPQIVISNTQAESSVQEALTQYNTPVVFIPMEAVNKSLKENPDVEDFYLGKVDDPDTHVALVMCSSGTSGKPKGVEVTHTVCVKRMHEHVYQFFSSNNNNSNCDIQEVILNISGPFWVTCHLVIAHTFNLGNKLILLENFETDVFLGLIQKYLINHLLIGPDQLVAIAQHRATDEYDLTSLRTVLYAGSPVSHVVLNLAEENLRHQITNVYGMTECIAIEPNFEKSGGPGTIGIPLRGVEVKVADLDTGNPVGPNVNGELRFKTHLGFKGYRGNEQATKEAYDESGFMHTGDVGYYDEDGFFYAVDRLKDIFKYNGIHVSTADIEEVLLHHVEVLEAAVVGIQHATNVTHATAFVVTRPDACVKEQDLTQLVESKLPSYKWLYGGVHFISTLPKTATGKIRKLDLRETYKKLNQECCDLFLLNVSS